MVSKAALDAAKKNQLAQQTAKPTLPEEELKQLSEHAKNLVEEQFRTSPNFEFARRRLELFPKLDLTELELGKVLGKGQFGVVSEIKAVFLSKDISTKPEEEAVVEDGDQDEKFKVEQEGRDFIAQHCVREESGDARYAVKLLNEEHFTEPEGFYQGVRDMAIEAHFLAAIEHPNIIKLRGLSVEDFGGKKFFLIMDRLYGTLEGKLHDWAVKDRKRGGLKSLVDKDRRRDKKRAFLKSRLEVALDLSAAIMFLHQNKIIDRDLKPENIGFDVRGDVKLFDFGLSTEFNPDDEKPYNLTGKTGSMRYMAPEVFFEEPYDESVDIFSFGIILWQIISLDKCYVNFTMKMMEDHVMTKGIRPKLDPTWSDSVTRLIKNMWSATPADRPAARQLNILLKREISTLGGDTEMEQNLTKRRSTFVQRRFTSVRNVKKSK